ncbi:MAG: Maf family protein [Acidobacteria bacterium]|nr:Maf family protein [Acidobacteriota bacterium]
MKPAPRLVLASGSPRRRETLARLGFEFTVRPVDIDESRGTNENALDYVRRLAEEKARTDARQGEIILAADTIVELDGELLGKPKGAEAAAAMLRRLSGRDHEVSTGVAVFDVDRDHLEVAVETTVVRFAPLEPTEIAWYVASGEPMDKAGAYAIQGLASLFVESIEGNYANVVGLPVPTVYRMLLKQGIPPPEKPT